MSRPVVRVVHVGGWKYEVTMKIDHQRFHIWMDPATKKRAEWYAKNLRIALRRLKRNWK